MDDGILLLLLLLLACNKKLETIQKNGVSVLSGEMKA
jgi:hypothetical protein